MWVPDISLVTKLSTPTLDDKVARENINCAAPSHRPQHEGHHFVKGSSQIDFPVCHLFIGLAIRSINPRRRLLDLLLLLRRFFVISRVDLCQSERYSEQRKSDVRYGNIDLFIRCDSQPPRSGPKPKPGQRGNRKYTASRRFLARKITRLAVVSEGLASHRKKFSSSAQKVMKIQDGSKTMSFG